MENFKIKTSQWIDNAKTKIKANPVKAGVAVVAGLFLFIL